MPDVIVAIDQGTTGSTVMLMDTDSNVISRGYREIQQIYPQPGWVEHDATDIWDSVIGALSIALEKPGVKTTDIKALGITNQRETVVFWNKKTGVPYHNAIVWQCRRTADMTARMKTLGQEDLFTRKTGLVLDPYFSGTKIKWLFENIPGLTEEAIAGNLAAGTIDSWLMYKLTGGRSHVTDITNASRTLLMDLARGEWDDELCALLDIPRAILPEIRGCTDIFGHTRNVDCLPDGIPISGVAGDQQAALFGQACFEPGEAKCTFGTGAFMLINAGEKPVASKNRLLSTSAWKIDNKAVFALEGSAFMAGAAVQWLRDELGIIKSAPQVEQLAASVPDTLGVIFVPAFVGLPAPHWRPEARGLITGLTRGAGAGHLARAVLEGIALQNVEILLCMEADAQKKITRLKVDGGASANNLLMQMQADLLGCEIVRPVVVETTALGAAYLAGLGARLYESVGDIQSAWKEDRVFYPQMDEPTRSAILMKWRQAVAKS